MSDDDKFITVPVRVPADLTVERAHGWLRLSNAQSYISVEADHGDASWDYALMQQIAAAVEARKPKPPKFQVGDVVEYVGIPVAGIVTAVHAPKDGTEPAYFLNNLGYSVFESAFKLVRRAEK